MDLLAYFRVVPYWLGAYFCSYHHICSFPVDKTRTPPSLSCSQGNNRLYHRHRPCLQDKWDWVMYFQSLPSGQYQALAHHLKSLLFLHVLPLVVPHHIQLEGNLAGNVLLELLISPRNPE